MSVNLGRVLEICFGLHLSGLNAGEALSKILPYVILSPTYLFGEIHVLFRGYAACKQFFKKSDPDFESIEVKWSCTNC